MKKKYIKPSINEFVCDRQISLIMGTGGGGGGGNVGPGPGPGPRPGKKSAELGDGIDYNPFKTDDEY
ncbi:MAG: hypothetical protein J6Y82_05765 [Bacteroidales bacterium]|nr:hypothetical protein [Bacteroidales bacterium]